MAQDAVATMGTILPPECGGRDAVHVAVISATAARRLKPGDHVTYDAAKQTADHGSNQVGIVDPFIQTTVSPGQRFWLFLYPRTITSLRHNWTHPSFPDESEPADNGAIYATPAQQLASKQWINELASQYGFTADRMIEAAKEWIDYEEYWNDGGTFEGESVPDEFWTHYERVTGTIVPDNRRYSFFTCSC